MYFDVPGLRFRHIFPGGFGSFEYMDPPEYLKNINISKREIYQQRIFKAIP